MLSHTAYLDEFATDWRLAGKAPTTVATYRKYLEQLATFAPGDSLSLADVKAWLEISSSPETARSRARAVRAFGSWAMNNDGPEWYWWKKVPLANVAPTPQTTVTPEEYRAVLSRAKSPRDRLVVELLWCSGMRVSEIARLSPADVNLSDGYVVIREAKSREPRLAPLSVNACRLLRRYEAVRETSLLGMTRTAIQLLMKRLGAPSPHAWRRGWAVDSLRQGVSQTSVQNAAGWASGAMVSRYTRALSGELAISEFKRRH